MSVSAKEMETIVHRGGCFCGELTYEVTGLPILSAFCHCSMCQRLNGCPCVQTMHFPAAAFSWTHSKPNTAVMDSFIVPTKPWKTRVRCKICGGCIASYNSKLNKYSVWGGQLERDESGKIKNWESVKPTAHIFYETRILDVVDGLGKWKGYENESERIS